MDNLDASNHSHASGEQGQVATFTSIASDATHPTPEQESNKVRPLLVRVKESDQVREYKGDAARSSAYEAMRKDAKELPLMELAAKYPGEYNSFRGAKRAPKTRGIPFDPRLSDFRNWLIHLGPKPAPEFTADRINGFEGYRPGNIRWACKVKQTENRSSTRWVKLPDGSTVKAKQLAAMAGKPYHTIRKQLERGWPVERILERTATGDPLGDWAFPMLCREELEREYRKRDKLGQTRIDFLIERLQWLGQRATDAGLTHESLHLRLQIAGLKAEREQLQAKAADALSNTIRGLIDGLTHKPAKPSPLPNLPPPTPQATVCKTVTPKKMEEPKATAEEVLAMLQQLGNKKFGSGQQPQHKTNPQGHCYEHRSRHLACQWQNPSTEERKARFRIDFARRADEPAHQGSEGNEQAKAART